MPRKSVYVGRIPHVQVYLTDDLHKIVQSQGLSASRLLQDAVRGHDRRQEKIAELHTYVQEIYDELGPPTPEDIEWAETKVREIVSSLRAGEKSDSGS